jgi:hypothetical protein
MKRWEYMLAKIGAAPDMNELGADGWELCAIVRGNGWFKRDRIAHELHSQRLEQTKAAGPVL